MENAINRARVKRALEALREAERELEAALREADRPRADPPSNAAKVAKRRLRRLLEG
jgi:hypothetical protein